MNRAFWLICLLSVCTIAAHAQSVEFCAYLCLPGYYSPDGTGYGYASLDGVEVANETCTICPAGYKCPDLSSPPIACYNGTYAFEGSVNCTACAAGYECPSTTGEGISECDWGTYSAGRQVSCTVCPAGYACPSRTDPSLNTECESGSYSTGGQTACTLCSAGHYCPYNKADDEYPCLAGQYAPEGSAECFDCPEGTHMAKDVADSCIECGMGTYSSTGQLYCTPCDAGRYCDSDGLGSPSGMCSSGYLCVVNATTPTPTDGTTGYRCPAGHFCPVGTQAAQPCPSGYYLDTEGGEEQADCLACFRGKYCNGTGLTKVSGDCTAGYYCPAEAAISTPTPSNYECPTGSYCPAGSDEPIVCPDGSYQDSPGMSSCDECEAGYYCTGGVRYSCEQGYYCPANSSVTDAFECPEGTYGKSTNLKTADECEPCEPGYYCAGTGLVEPTAACSAGYYCTSGATHGQPVDEAFGGICPAGSYCPTGCGSPLACEAGTYSSTTGRSSCVECTAGSYCGSGGLTNVTGPCESGYYCISGASTSTPTDGATGDICPAGSHCASGSSSPTLCSPGTYSGVGQGSCSQCDAGYYCPDSGLTSPFGPCSAGYICISGSSTATPTNGITGYRCPAGYYCLAGETEPTPCPDGYFLDSMGGLSLDDCLLCLGGMYCAESGLSEPTGDCSSGYYCPADAAISSATPSSYLCPSGSYCPSGSAAPLSCPDAMYQDEEGQGSCKDCPAGSYCSSGVLRTCPQGYYCPSNSSAGTDFPCPAGTYNSKTARTSEADCLDCLGGHYCEGVGNSNATGPCSAGYYCTSGSPVSQPSDAAYGGVCPRGFYCPEQTTTPKSCLAGTYGPVEGLAACRECAAGSYCETGGLTAVSGECLEGYYCSGGASSPSPTDGVTGDLCPSGSYCANGTSVPEPCPEGTYSGEGQPLCTACDSGMVATTTGLSACSACPAGFACPSSDGSDMTMCLSGTYSAGGQSECYTCPAGLACPHTDSAVTEVCSSGTYSVGGQASCTTCPGGFACPNADGSGIFECEAGTYAPAGSTSCSECDSGSYAAISGMDECDACPAGYYCNTTTATACPAQTWSAEGKSLCTNDCNYSLCTDCASAVCLWCVGETCVSSSSLCASSGIEDDNTALCISSDAANEFTSSVSGSGRATATAGTEASFTVYTRNGLSQLVDADVSVEIAGEVTISPTLVVSATGTTAVSYVATLAGDYAVAVLVYRESSDVDSTGWLPIDGSPFDLLVSAGTLNTTTSDAYGAGLLNFIAGSGPAVYVHARDVYANTITDDALSFTAVYTSSSEDVSAVLTLDADVSVYVGYAVDVTVAAEYTVSVSGDAGVIGSPAAIVVSPGDVSLSMTQISALPVFTSGYADSFLLYPTDAYDNPVGDPTGTFAVIATSDTSSVNGIVEETSAYGVVNVTLTFPSEASWSLSVTYNGADVASSPYTVDSHDPAVVSFTVTVTEAVTEPTSGFADTTAARRLLVYAGETLFDTSLFLTKLARAVPDTNSRAIVTLYGGISTAVVEVEVDLLQGSSGDYADADDLADAVLAAESSGLLALAMQPEYTISGVECVSCGSSIASTSFSPENTEADAQDEDDTSDNIIWLVLGIVCGVLLMSLFTFAMRDFLARRSAGVVRIEDDIEALKAERSLARMKSDPDAEHIDVVIIVDADFDQFACEPFLRRLATVLGVSSSCFQLRDSQAGSVKMYVSVYGDDNYSAADVVDLLRKAFESGSLRKTLGPSALQAPVVRVILPEDKHRVTLKQAAMATKWIEYAQNQTEFGAFDTSHIDMLGEVAKDWSWGTPRADIFARHAKEREELKGKFWLAIDNVEVLKEDVDELMQAKIIEQHEAMGNPELTVEERSRLAKDFEREIQFIRTSADIRNFSVEEEKRCETAMWFLSSLFQLEKRHREEIVELQRDEQGKCDAILQTALGQAQQAIKEDMKARAEELVGIRREYQEEVQRMRRRLGQTPRGAEERQRQLQLKELQHREYQLTLTRLRKEYKARRDLNQKRLDIIQKQKQFHDEEMSQLFRQHSEEARVMLSAEVDSKLSDLFMEVKADHTKYLRMLARNLEKVMAKAIREERRKVIESLMTREALETDNLALRLGEAEERIIYVQDDLVLEKFQQEEEAKEEYYRASVQMELVHLRQVFRTWTFMCNLERCKIEEEANAEMTRELSWLATTLQLQNQNELRELMEKLIIQFDDEDLTDSDREKLTKLHLQAMASLEGQITQRRRKRLHQAQERLVAKELALLSKYEQSSAEEAERVFHRRESEREGELLRRQLNELEEVKARAQSDMDVLLEAFRARMHGNLAKELEEHLNRFEMNASESPRGSKRQLFDSRLAVIRREIEKDIDTRLKMVSDRLEDTMKQKIERVRRRHAVERERLEDSKKENHSAQELRARLLSEDAQVFSDYTAALGRGLEKILANVEKDHDEARAKLETALLVRLGSTTMSPQEKLDAIAQYTEELANAEVLCDYEKARQGVGLRNKLLAKRTKFQGERLVSHDAELRVAALSAEMDEQNRELQRRITENEKSFDEEIHKLGGMMISVDNPDGESVGVGADGNTVPRIRVSELSSDPIAAMKMGTQDLAAAHGATTDTEAIAVDLAKEALSNAFAGVLKEEERNASACAIAAGRVAQAAKRAEGDKKLLEEMESQAEEELVAALAQHDAQFAEKWGKAIEAWRNNPDAAAADVEALVAEEEAATAALLARHADLKTKKLLSGKEGFSRNLQNEVAEKDRIMQLHRDAVHNLQADLQNARDRMQLDLKERLQARHRRADARMKRRHNEELARRGMTEANDELEARHKAELSDLKKSLDSDAKETLEAAKRMHQTAVASVADRQRRVADLLRNMEGVAEEEKERLLAELERTAEVQRKELQQQWVRQKQTLQERLAVRKRRARAQAEARQLRERQVNSGAVPAETEEEMRARHAEEEKENKDWGDQQANDETLFLTGGFDIVKDIVTKQLDDDKALWEQHTVEARKLMAWHEEETKKLRDVLSSEAARQDQHLKQKLAERRQRRVDAAKKKEFDTLLEEVQAQKDENATAVKVELQEEKKKVEARLLEEEQEAKRLESEKQRLLEEHQKNVAGIREAVDSEWVRQEQDLKKKLAARRKAREQAQKRKEVEAAAEGKKDGAEGEGAGEKQPEEADDDESSLRIAQAQVDAAVKKILEDRREQITVLQKAQNLSSAVSEEKDAIMDEHSKAVSSMQRHLNDERMRQELALRKKLNERMEKQKVMQRRRHDEELRKQKEEQARRIEEEKKKVTFDVSKPVPTLATPRFSRQRHADWDTVRAELELSAQEEARRINFDDFHIPPEYRQAFAQALSHVLDKIKERLPESGDKKLAEELLRGHGVRMQAAMEEAAVDRQKQLDNLREKVESRKAQRRKVHRRRDTSENLNRMQAAIDMRLVQGSPKKPDSARGRQWQPPVLPATQ